jgi:ATP-dependent exoDNAse (exonuclease V) alpha subunit
LNTELKLLYTAITRARANVWIFDEDEESRAPMFYYFQQRKLVETTTHVNGKYF